MATSRSRRMMRGKEAPPASMALREGEKSLITSGHTCSFSSHTSSACCN